MTLLFRKKNSLDFLISNHYTSPPLFGVTYNVPESTSFHNEVPFFLEEKLVLLNPLF